MTTDNISRTVRKSGKASYRVRVEIARDPKTGRRRWRTGTFDTLPEAKRKRAEWMLDPTAAAAKAPLAEYLRDAYLPDYQRRFRASSYRKTRQAFERWWIPLLGAVPLGALTTQRIERACADILAAGLKPGTVDARLRTLAAALNTAIRWGYLENNPCAKVRLAAAAPEDRPPLWTPAQLQRLFAQADGVWAMLWRLLAGTGMRIGEARALRWSDVDWDVPAIRIRRTFARGDEGEYESTTKSEAGRRDVVVGQALLTILQTWRREQATALWAHGKAIEGSTHLLTLPDGTRLPESRCYSQWQRAVRLADVPYRSIHTLRHLATSEQLAAGVPLKTVSARIGHSTIQLTADLYGHVLAEHQGAAAEVLDRLVAPRVVAEPTLLNEHREADGG